MTTKERIQSEIEHVSDQDLEELYRLVKEFARTKASETRKSGVLSKLKRIRIEAPEDFAANLDAYLSGEKPLASDENLR